MSGLEKTGGVCGKLVEYCNQPLTKGEKIGRGVIGAIIAIAGIFLLLAAKKILPAGTNAISQLGKGGLAMGGIAAGAGGALLLTSILKPRCLGRDEEGKPYYEVGVEDEDDGGVKQD